ncbi:MAG: peptidase S41 [Flavobacteriaceae bacterium]|nr:peptidase S41 [Flavobacteriaceae bacterium]|tara:strand:+ start:470711 stop:472147 length:1437 start_codon:yes stop_codon:yes gene_type:complete
MFAENLLNMDKFPSMTFRTLLLLLILGFTTAIHSQQFSKKEVLEDLRYLKFSLEDTHIDLYAHTSKEAFESNFELMKSKVLKDSLTLLETTNLFQRVVAQINNAHTVINFPVQSYYEFIDSEGMMFPLELVLENGKVLVRKNWSTEDRISVGDELEKINGIPIEDILQKIYPIISAERPYFKNALIESFSFPRYYWQVFGEEKVFELEIVQKGINRTYKIAAVLASRYESDRVDEDVIQQNWKFDIHSKEIAYLRPGKFSGDLPKYQEFIDASFQKINQERIPNLIIDLRNHPGGDDSFGDYLVSFIADKPFQWYSKFELRTSAILKELVRKKSDTTTAYSKSILSHKDGEVFPYQWQKKHPKPQHMRFKGRVYVLVNRHSYSQSTVTSAQIQDYGFGIVVGEETAEFPNLHASIFDFELPITKIKVRVPKGRIKRVSGIETEQGLMPDILIQDQLANEEDELLQYVIDHINKSKEHP